MSIYYVYQYLRSDGTPYYIGKGYGNRAYSKYHNVHLPEDQKNIIILKENMLETDAFSLEIELIAKYGRKDIGTGILRNLTNGGEGVSGYTHKKETRYKQSISAKNRRKATQETRDKMSASAKKRFNNPEERAKTAAAQKLLWTNLEYHDKQSSLIKIAQMTPESRKKMSAIRKKQNN